MAREAIEVLKECEAFLEGHFLLSSGRHSGAYCQMAFLQQYPGHAAPRSWRRVAEQLKDLDVDVVVGPAMGGIVYAYELGRQLGKRAIFTERVDNVMTLKRFASPSRRSAASSPRTWSPPASPAWRPSVSSRRPAASLPGHRLRGGPHPRRGPVPHSHPGQRAQAGPAQLRRRRSAPSARRASCPWSIWAAAR